MTDTAKSTTVRRLPFDCLRCSKCCTGEGASWLEEHEVAPAAALLGMTAAEFKQAYCRRDSQGRWLIGTDEQSVCLVLGPEGCRIHQAKPRICRAWPFLDAMLRSADAFEEAKLVCPGLDPEATHREFLEFYHATQDKES